MTGLRHLLLALVAAGLALVLGVGLGAGPVTEDAAAERAAATDRLRDRVDRLRDEVRTLETGAARDTAAVKALAGPLTDGALTERSVLLVDQPLGKGATIMGIAGRRDARCA